MMRGLEGRRIALVSLDSDPSAEMRRAIANALEQAGATIHGLEAGAGSDEDWHGARYAGLVLAGAAEGDAGEDERLVQLAREFLASEKPVAAFGNALSVLLQAGGAAGRTLAAHDGLKAAVEGAGGKAGAEPIVVDGALVTAQEADANALAARVVQEFTRQLEDHDLDDMSEQSFPASDPPATSPASIGPAAPGQRGG